eukprot:TRINITY_DN14372_c0_g1_i2.p1 TRINITY_DN14372_c0_g1~~TRINITY_DN14372_c0_g1_i2.p1  ORF type:complete len:178 (+),score=66.97 TRINITY_DN14372_c0_g1_i2:74-535(+)
MARWTEQQASDLRAVHAALQGAPALPAAERLWRYLVACGAAPADQVREATGCSVGAEGQVIEVHVSVNGRAPVAVEVLSTATVRDLGVAAGRATGVAPRHQELRYQGQVLGDLRAPLADLGIGPECRVDLADMSFARKCDAASAIQGFYRMRR